MSALATGTSPSSTLETRWPSVSVLMPVRNEKAHIARSLEAVLSQSYPGPLEVLVVDGMSDDGTREDIRAIADSDSRVRLLDNPARLVATALNLGAQHAQGSVFVRVDGRALLPPGYVQACVQLLRTTGAANVGGVQVPVADTYQGGAVAAAMSSPFGVGPARFRFSSRPQVVDTVYLGAWPRDAFEGVGGFDETLVRNQDYEFNYRLRQAGGEVVFSPDLRVEYYGRSTLSGLWRQYLDYGFWKARVIELSPGSARPRHFVAPAFVLGLVAGGLLALSVPALRVAYGLALVAYLVLAVAFSVAQAARHGWQYLLVLPLVFLTLHLSWGLGFWRGVLRWWLGSGHGARV